MGGMTSYYLTLRDEETFAGAILVAPALMNLVNGFLVGVSKVLGAVMPEKISYPRKRMKGRSERNP